MNHRMRDLYPWIDHVRKLGCTAIYIGPLFESTTHGYDTRDYKLVDRRLGDNEDFKEFVSRAHKLGIRVVVDGVLTTRGGSFLPSGIFRKTGSNPHIGTGIRESISGGITPTMTGSATKPGGIALSL